MRNDSHERNAATPAGRWKLRAGATNSSEALARTDSAHSPTTGMQSSNSARRDPVHAGALDTQPHDDVELRVVRHAARRDSCNNSTRQPSPRLQRSADFHSTSGVTEHPRPQLSVQLGRIIGKGTEGAVYLALNTTSGSLVAAKEVHTSEGKVTAASVRKEVDLLAYEAPSACPRAWGGCA